MMRHHKENINKVMPLIAMPQKEVDWAKQYIMQNLSRFITSDS